MVDCQKEYPICENCGSHVMENGCECGEYTGLKRGWPWDHFPEDKSTWDECVRQYRILKDKVTEYECRQAVEFKDGKGVYCSHCGWAGTEHDLANNHWSQLCPVCRLDSGLGGMPQDEVWMVLGGRVVRKIKTGGVTVGMGKPAGEGE